MFTFPLSLHLNSIISVASHKRQEKEPKLILIHNFQCHKTNSQAKFEEIWSQSTRRKISQNFNTELAIFPSVNKGIILKLKSLTLSAIKSSYYLFL